MDETTWRRSPRSSVERPVPPPIATTRSGRAETAPATVCPCGSVPRVELSGVELFVRVTEALWHLGIQQLSKPGVVRHALEIVVDASLKPVPGVHFDCLGRSEE